MVAGRDLERALDQAEIRGVFDRRALGRVLGRHSTRRGAAALRALLDQYAVADGLTRSELEERFLALCVRSDLPRPELNVPLFLADGDTAVVDALWRRERLVIETDGRATHATGAAFERDRRRDAQLLLAGFAVVRFTWHQVTQDAPYVVATLRRLLGQASRGAIATGGRTV